MIHRKKKIDIFPIKHEIKNYSWEKAKSDFQAGLNVALLDFPQAMAYALIAGLPLLFGVYASAVASLIGPLFSSSKHAILGATNSTAVLILSTFLTLDLSLNAKLIALPVLVLLVGIFILAAALLRLAGLIKYVSRTVITGYITAAGLLIIVNQLNHILGTPNVQAATFFEVLIRNIIQWQFIKWEPLSIALLTATVFICVNRFLAPVPRVAVTLGSVSVLAYAFSHLGMKVPVIQLDPTMSSPFVLPRLDFEVISQMGSLAIAVAFLAILESSSIAKTLAARSGKRLDLNQQLFSVGIANISSAFFSGMPVSSSLTRSMLNYNSQAKTVFSSIFSGLFLVLGILIFRPLLGFIPKSALATVVVFLGASLINIDQMRCVIRSTRSDATVFFITFLGGLFFPLTMAISLGAIASIILFLQKISEPHLVQYAFDSEGKLAEKELNSQKDVPEISIVHVEGELFFGSTDIFLEQMRLICESPNLKVIVLRVRNAHYLDASSALAICDLLKFAKEKERFVVVSGANEQVEKVFTVSGAMHLLGKENFFKYTPENPNLSTRRALKRAQEIIGKEKAKIFLYTAPHQGDDKEDESA